MSIRRLPLQRLSYLVSCNNVFFINRSPFSKAIFLTVKEVVICRGKGIVADLCTPGVKNIPTDESIIRKFFLSSTFKLWWPSGRKRNRGSVYGNWKSEFLGHPGVSVFRGSEVWVVVTPHLFMSSTGHETASSGADLGEGCRGCALPPPPPLRWPAVF